MANYSVREMREYLLKEQGYTKEQVRNIPVEELCDLYEMYHED